VTTNRIRFLEAWSEFSTIAADERVLDVAFTDDSLNVSLRDGRVISVPLVWYPRLLNATPAQRKNWKIAGGGYGIHWPDLMKTSALKGCCGARPRREYVFPRSSENQNTHPNCKERD
jgi:hypothetical protein